MNIKKASNNQIKLWRKLKRRKQRGEESLFLAEGVRCVEQILDNGMIRVKEIVVMEGRPLPDPVAQYGENCFSVPESLFGEISDTENPRGVMAVCHIPDEISLQSLTAPGGVIVAADGLQDPGNLGTIIRTASWFGSAGLIAGTGTVDPWHPKVVRSTAGATGALPLVSGELESMLPDLEEKGWRIVLLDGGEGAVPMQSVIHENKSVVVVGNEGNGIRQKLLHAGKGWIRTEITGAGNNRIESLNAAVALSIALYQLGAA